MASPLSDLLMPSSRQPASVSWNGESFEVACSCSGDGICAHVEDFFARMGDVQYCKDTNLNLFDRSRSMLVPFAQDLWVECSLTKFDLSRDLHWVTERMAKTRDDGSRYQEDGFKFIIGAGESLVGYIRALQDHYRGTPQYDEVMNSLMAKLALPCFVPGHKRPSSDLAFMRELKAYVIMYLHSYDVPIEEATRYTRIWSAEDMKPAFRQIALKQARFLINHGMCSICWKSNTRPGNVDPDLIPDL